MSYQFSDEIARKMKLFYQEEYAKTLHRANELKSILDQMEHVEVNTHDSSLPVLSKGAVVVNEVQETIATTPLNTAAPVKKRKKYKKRKKDSPRSEWAIFILTRLKATQQPLSYDDMANHAIAIKNLDKASFDAVRKSLMGAAFSLRTKYNKIDSYAIKGSRTKYLGLVNWFEREGKLKEEFQQKL